MRIKSDERISTFPSLKPPFIVRQFERAYTLELRKLDWTARPDKIRAVSCM